MQMGQREWGQCDHENKDMSDILHFKDAGRGHSSGCRWLLEDGKGKEVDFSWEPPEEPRLPILWLYPNQINFRFLSLEFKEKWICVVLSH